MDKIYYTFINLDNDTYDFCGFANIRKDYINHIKDKHHKNQSYYVWKLLLFALKELNLSHDLQFICTNGKWTLKNENLHFSLSHSYNLVSVIVSDKVCGVDVEKVSDKSLKLAKRLIEDKNELKFFNNLNEPQKIIYLTKKWTETECKYKSNYSTDLISTEVIVKNGIEFVMSFTSNSKPIEIFMENII